MVSVCCVRHGRENHRECFYIRIHAGSLAAYIVHAFVCLKLFSFSTIERFWKSLLWDLRDLCAYFCTMTSASFLVFLAVYLRFARAFTPKNFITRWRKIYVSGLDFGWALITCCLLLHQNFETAKIFLSLENSIKCILLRDSDLPLRFSHYRCSEPFDLDWGLLALLGTTLDG